MAEAIIGGALSLRGRLRSPTANSTATHDNFLNPRNQPPIHTTDPQTSRRTVLAGETGVLNFLQRSTSYNIPSTHPHTLAHYLLVNIPLSIRSPTTVLPPDRRALIHPIPPTRHRHPPRQDLCTRTILIPIIEATSVGDFGPHSDLVEAATEATASRVLALHNGHPMPRGPALGPMTLSPSTLQRLLRVASPMLATMQRTARTRSAHLRTCRSRIPHRLIRLPRAILSDPKRLPLLGRLPSRPHLRRRSSALRLRHLQSPLRRRPSLKFLKSSTLLQSGTPHSRMTPRTGIANEIVNGSVTETETEEETEIANVIVTATTAVIENAIGPARRTSRLTRTFFGVPRPNRRRRGPARNPGNLLRGPAMPPLRGHARSRRR